MLYKKYGAFKKENGFIFRTYAPAADKVYLLINSNKTLMNKNENDWELFIDNTDINVPYFFVIEKANKEFEKSDPFARKVLSPYIGTLKSLTTNSTYEFKAAKVNKKDTIKICEVFMETLQGFNYKEKADTLVQYLQDKNYTHVQIMPIYHFSSIETLGYMSNSYFAPSSNYGEIDDFKYFIDKLHENKYGVIMDFVLFEFGTDRKGLDNFDGGYLFNRNQHEKHEIYGGYLFDINKEFVQDFLSSAMNYYINEFNIDGFRLDALNEIIFRDKRINEFDYKEFESLKKIIEKVDECLIIAENISPIEYSKSAIDKIDYVEHAAYMYKINHLFKLETFERFKHKDYNDLFIQDVVFNKNKNFIASISHDLFVNGKTIKNDIYSMISQDYKFEKQKIKLVMLYAAPGNKMVFKDYNIGFEDTDIINYFQTFMKFYDENIGKDYKDFKIEVDKTLVTYKYIYKDKTICFIFNIGDNFIELENVNDILLNDERNKFRNNKLVIKSYTYCILKK
jgi:1,4-alpha-glucan branching enzyme